MLKLNKIYLAKILIGLFLFLPANAEFDIKTDTVILQDYLSGKILFEKEPDKHIYPASMTKIMTTDNKIEKLQKVYIFLRFGASGVPESDSTRKISPRGGMDCK